MSYYSCIDIYLQYILISLYQTRLVVGARLSQRLQPVSIDQWRPTRPPHTLPGIRDFFSSFLNFFSGSRRGSEEDKTGNKESRKNPRKILSLCTWIRLSSLLLGTTRLKDSEEKKPSRRKKLEKSKKKGNCRPILCT